ncbi:hypothetical protein RHGRI_017124 [Rhododendron griersonianum]|uniref:MATH domain-containing protein n=1 Tax=Rhododendron griersonianum TaxID=479676 RepID=A0AAV6JWR1_9ERIC|nr:hypothetical protein RHGRI_017124 [Rhododendron griersonianum]
MTLLDQNLASYTWKIDKFSQINKRELRSNAIEVGGYKWYVEPAFGKEQIVLSVALIVSIAENLFGIIDKCRANLSLFCGRQKKQAREID